MTPHQTGTNAEQPVTRGTVAAHQPALSECMCVLYCYSMWVCKDDAPSPGPRTISTSWLLGPMGSLAHSPVPVFQKPHPLLEVLVATVSLVSMMLSSSQYDSDAKNSVS